SEAVAGIIARHVIPCTLEYLDRATHALTDDYSPTGLPRDAEAILLIEVDGHPAQVEDDAAAVEEELRRAGGDIRVARDAAEKDRIWTARRNALPALARARPTTLLEDATVPRSKVPDMVEAIAKVAATHQVRIATFGHAGDGNLHPTFLYDRRDQAESARVAAAVDDIFRAALDLGGTLSGEHGIGTAKAAWLENETGRGHLLYSRRLRKGVDPKGLLNPDKLVGVRG
ncbi:MAG: glycolate oxidase subunit GlcD, partial [Desulfovibrionaceae bacterium]